MSLSAHYRDIADLYNNSDLKERILNKILKKIRKRAEKGNYSFHTYLFSYNRVVMKDVIKYLKEEKFDVISDGYGINIYWKKQ